MPDNKNDVMREFARRLQQEMVRKGWSQSDLARQAQKFMPEGKEFGRHLINYYTRTRGLPTPIYLKALSDALDIPTEELLPAQEDWKTKDLSGVQIKTIPDSEEVWIELKQRVSMEKALEIMRLLKE